MIAFHPKFKEQCKNLFLALSSFNSNNILMCEHLVANSPTGDLPSDNPFVRFLNNRLEDLVIKVDQLYTDFQESVFGALQEEQESQDDNDSDGGYPELNALQLLGVTPLIPKNIETVKQQFDQER